MMESNRITCDHRNCHKEILPSDDIEIVGNCSFHVSCWNLLNGDPDEWLEFLREEGGGHA